MTRASAVRSCSPSRVTRTFGLAMVTVMLGCTAQPRDCTPDEAPLVAPDELPASALCDGSEALRLRAQVLGSGQVLPGSAVLSENGFDFLAVDGRCHFWVQQRSFGPVHEGFLDVAQADELLAALRTDSWASMAGTYRSSLCDGPGHRYRFDGAEIDIIPVCNGQRTDGPVEWIRPAVRSAIDRLFAIGTQVRGPVRFTLLRNDELEFPSSSEAFRAAPQWPLRRRAEDVALGTSDVRGSTGPFQRADPPEAACLQAIATQYRQRAIGDAIAGFAPIVSEGRRFRLFVRDSVPFEDADGRW